MISGFEKCPVGCHGDFPHAHPDDAPDAHLVGRAVRSRRHHRRLRLGHHRVPRAHVHRARRRRAAPTTILLAYVGPPLLDSLRLTAGFDDAEAWEALNVYRDHYADHVLRSPVFPGVAGVLERLHAAGVPARPRDVEARVDGPRGARPRRPHAVLHRDRRRERRRGAAARRPTSSREALRGLREQRRRRLRTP